MKRENNDRKNSRTTGKTNGNSGNVTNRGKRFDGRENSRRRFEASETNVKSKSEYKKQAKPDFREEKYDVYQEEESSTTMIMGRNAVMEAIKNEREIDKIFVGKELEGSVKKIIGMAKEKGIPLMPSDKIALDRISKGGTHQGVIAYVAAYDYCEPEDILAYAEEKREKPIVVILDNLEDPHNFGAIMRTAEVIGAHGIIIPKRRSVGITDTVVKASAGAAEYVKCAKVSNIVSTIEWLKEKGVWIHACDMDGQPYYQGDFSGAIGIVIGSEGAGISRLVREKCDFVVSIPMVGKITSLNASNAAAVIMCEVRKQRDIGKV